MSEKRRRSLRTKGESPLEKRIKTEEAAAVNVKKPTPTKTTASTTTKSTPAKSNPIKAEKKKVTKIHAKSGGRRSVAAEVEDDVTESPAPKEATDVRPLPTVQQDAAIPVEDLQSIAESGVLASAMLRSRAKWTSDGIFPKYWSKPRIKSGKPIEPPGNPPKDSFSRLGRCRITVEPHILETVLYSIKEPKSAAATNAQTPMINYTPPQPPRPVSNSPSAVNTPSTVKPPVPSPQPHAASPQPPAAVAATPKAAAPPSTTSQSTTPASSTPKTAKTAQDAKHAAAPSRSAPKSAVAPPASATSNPPQSLGQKPTSSAVPAPPPGQDPVIQMLAQRASTDPSLKVLMKTVAAGEASKEELNTFQRHIDELHRIIAEQRKAGILPGVRPAVPSAQYPNKPQGSGPSPNYQGGHTSTFSAGYRPPVPAKSKPPPPPGQRVIGIAVEFAGSPDRYLFPKHTMLEIFPGGTRARASFVVVRRGSLSQSAGFEAGKEYNQPVTIFLDVDEPKVMHTIASSLAPADEVRKHMDGAIEKSSRGPSVTLALRVPKASEDATALVDETTTITTEQRKSMREAAKSQKAADEWASLCRHCFTYVPGGALRAGPGGAVCQACQALSQRAVASTAGSLSMYRKGPQQLRESHGQLALTLEG